MKHDPMPPAPPGKLLRPAGKYRQPEDGNRLAIGMAASLAVHGGVTAALFLGLANSKPAAPPPAAMVIEIATLPSAPPTPPTEAPPTPEQQEAKPKPVVNKIKLPLIPRLAFNVKPEVAVPLKDIEDPNKRQAEKPADETTKAAAPFAERKDDPKAPNMGAPSNNNSNAEQSWEARVLAALERKKRYPSAAQSAGQQDLVWVSISMDRGGRVTASRIKRSHGFSSLDGEVLSMVRRASPFPKPPESVAGDPVTITVPVDFFIKRK